MKLIDSFHYFVRKKRIFLTSISWEFFKNIKITGSKIELFFNLEDEESSCKPMTPFQIWKEVMNWGKKKKNPKKEEKNKDREKIIMNYLNKKMNRNWDTYPLETRDVFVGMKNLGGVPDGIERDQKLHSSVLEIKTKFIKEINIEKDFFKSLPTKYLLQLAFYLYLSNLEEGYLTFCSLWKRTIEIKEEINLTSDLERLPFYEQDWCCKKIFSYISEIGTCEFCYKILEVYKNTGENDNELLFIKFRFDIEKYKSSILKIEKWFEEHRKVSPEMSDEELREVLHWRNKRRK